MANAASTSNPSFIVEVGEAYPCPSHVIAPNFVTVKLSGKNKYNMWKTQMLCLLKSHQMYGFIDGQFPSPAGNGKGKVGDMEAWIMSDSLVKGWILGSLSEEAVNNAVNHLTHMQKKTDFTAKDLWDELQRSYGPPQHSDGPSVEEQATETNLMPRPRIPLKVLQTMDVEKKLLPRPKIPFKVLQTKDKDHVNKRKLYDNILKEESTREVIQNLKAYRIKPWDELTNNGNTVLHVAVGNSSQNYELFKELLEVTPKEKVDVLNSDGSTLLHVAAIGGNIQAVNMLVKKNPELLKVKDKEGHTPLALSISNMHTNTSKCLFKHIKEQKYDDLCSGKSGEELVVLATSCQDFSLGHDIILNFSTSTKLSGNDFMLTTLAQNFPRELNFWERRGDEFMEEVEERIKSHGQILATFLEYYNETIWSTILLTLVYYTIYGFCIIVTAVSLSLKAIVHPFIKDTSQVYEEAITLTELVCHKIFAKGDSNTYHKYYNKSIFEATGRNASTFIRTIMRKFPDAIGSTNEDGHNFIQYSVISRSEKIYNLLFEMSEHKNIYKTIKDYSGNNLLHLAARLAPTNKLNQISGAALQIQRELQWFKEVERFICPLNRLQKNLDDETPAMVFTREHKDLVIEGENWIKKTAESYTITAALIVTIVFAAAITVPGGNNQDSGIPIFTDNIAFKVFAISDAISLFTAVTSLLMFLSILTARFAEQDFLFKLPTKLSIGLTMLFLSTTAMIIAFGATLFLVFGQNNLLMLIPIGALTCLPITSFVTLQFPLIVELISATYCGAIFVIEKYEYFY